MPRGMILRGAFLFVRNTLGIALHFPLFCACSEEKLKDIEKPARLYISRV